MKRPLARLSLFFLFLLAAGGCGDDPASPLTPNNFAGDWALVSTVVQKAVCLGGQLSDTRIEELAITQDGGAVTLDFADFSLKGSAVDGALSASGTLPDGESMSVELRKAGATLQGSVQIDGSACQERRTVVATHRGGDADFRGHWALQLTVVGEGGCSFISDYADCFQIFQDGPDLLVVDEDAGNLFGTVIGDIAEIERDKPAENTWLILYLNDAGDRITGNAYRYFNAESCRTELEFVALLRNQPCSNPKHQI